MKRFLVPAFVFLLTTMIPGYGVYGQQQEPAPSEPQAPPEEELDDKALEELLKEIGEGAKGPEEKEEKKKVKEEKPLPPINMVYVEGGCFMMGDNFGDGDDDEKPVHEVCVEDFYISETEVTQELFEAVMGFNPSSPKGSDLPLVYSSWKDLREFLKRLSKRTGKSYRLPTEAEWEYAARGGGKKDKWPGTNDETTLSDYAWFSDNSEGIPHPVKQKKPNGLGLYDMGGNVWEWVEDYFDFDYYRESPKQDPEGPNFSEWKVIRGGSFLEEPSRLRASYRFGDVATLRSLNIGLRLAQ